MAKRPWGEARPLRMDRLSPPCRVQNAAPTAAIIRCAQRPVRQIHLPVCAPDTRGDGASSHGLKKRPLVPGGRGRRHWHSGAGGEDCVLCDARM